MLVTLGVRPVRAWFGMPVVNCSVPNSILPPRLPVLTIGVHLDTVGKRSASWLSLTSPLSAIAHRVPPLER